MGTDDEILLYIREKPRTVKEIYQVFGGFGSGSYYLENWITIGDVKRDGDTVSITEQGIRRVDQWWERHKKEHVVKELRKRLRKVKQVDTIIEKGLEKEFTDLVEKIKKAKGKAKTVHQSHYVLEIIKSKFEELSDSIELPEDEESEQYETLEALKESLESVIESLQSAIDALEEVEI